MSQNTSVLVFSDTAKLRELLANHYEPPFDYESFKKAAIKKFIVTESILFIEGFANLAKPEATKADVQHLLDNFLREGGNYELNIESGQRKKTIEQLTEALKNESLIIQSVQQILEPVHEHILYTLETDILPKYTKLVTTRKRVELAREDALWWRQKFSLKKFFSFPNPIDKADSRIHNICTVILITLQLLLDYYGYEWYKYICYYIIYSYWARVTCGPRLDIQSFIVLFLLRPLLSDVIPIFKSEFSAGLPRRFAVTLGGSFSLLALLLRMFVALAWASWGVWILLIVLGFFAGFLDKCLGCYMFGIMMKMGWIPETVCEECRMNYVSLAPKKAHKGKTAGGQNESHNVLGSVVDSHNKTQV